MTREQDQRTRPQVVGNAGLYFAAYQLTKLGWNVLPTARNARGVDLVMYDDAASRKVTVQVKSLRSKASIPLGSRPDHWIADWYVLCVGVLDKTPQCFVLTKEEVRAKAVASRRGESAGAKSYWLEWKDYSPFLDGWSRIA